MDSIWSWKHVFASYKQHTLDASRVVYTKDGCGCGCGFLSLVLFPWKRHNYNANHNHIPIIPHQPHYFVWVRINSVVVHAHVALLESFKAKVQEKVEEAITLTLQSKTSKDYNQFDFFSSPEPRTIIDYNLNDWPHHQSQPQRDFYKRKWKKNPPKNKKKTKTIGVVDCNNQPL